MLPRLAYRSIQASAGQGRESLRRRWLRQATATLLVEDAPREVFAAAGTVGARFQSQDREEQPVVRSRAHKPRADICGQELGEWCATAKGQCDTKRCENARLSQIPSELFCLRHNSFPRSSG